MAPVTVISLTVRLTALLRVIVSSVVSVALATPLAASDEKVTGVGALWIATSLLDGVKAYPVLLSSTVTSAPSATVILLTDR